MYFFKTTFISYDSPSANTFIIFTVPTHCLRQKLRKKTQGEIKNEYDNIRDKEHKVDDDDCNDELENERVREK